MHSAIQNPAKSSHQPDEKEVVPPGYTTGQAPNGQKYLVPTFLVPAMELAIATTISQISMNVQQAAGGVSIFLNLFFI